MQYHLQGINISKNLFVYNSPEYYCIGVTGNEMTVNAIISASRSALANFFPNRKLILVLANASCHGRDGT